MSEAYCYVRLEGWKYEWRTVQAENLEQALDLARAMPGVVSVLEVSWHRGGCLT